MPERGSRAASGSLFVPIYPGRRWEQRSAPLADDPRQDQPVSATVFDKQTLNDAKIEDVVDLVNAVPGLNFTSQLGNGENSDYTLRGAGRIAPFTTGDYPVGLTIDGVPVANPAAYNFEIFDIARAEVLRGPQGTLGGRNAIAGALNFETVPPQPIFETALTGSYGSFNDRAVSGSVNTPLVDGRLYQRFSAAYRKRDGNLSNLAGGKPINDRENWGLRQQLRWLIAPGFLADLSFDYSDFSPTLSAYTAFGQASDRTVTIVDPYEDDRRLYGGALRVTRDAGPVTLTSITGLRGLNYDSQGSNFNGLDLLRQGTAADQLQVSQELRLKGQWGEDVDWLGGVYGFWEDLEREGFREATGLAPALGLPPGHRETSSVEQTAYSLALYGDVTWHLTDRLDLFAGARLTYDKKEIDYRHLANDDIGALAPLQSLDDSLSHLDLSPRLGLTYDLSDEVILYGLVSKGYKAGGFNAFFVLGDALEFNREVAWNLELGVKSTWFDDRLVANAAAYWFEWEDQQVQSNSLGFPVTNAELSRSLGLELSLAGRPRPGLDLYLNLALTEAKFEDFKDFPANLTGISIGVPTDVSGNRLPYSSRFDIALGGQWIHPIESGLRLFGRVDFRYRSGFTFDPLNSLDETGYELLNARLGLMGEGWGLTLWGKNLTDATYRMTALGGVFPDGDLAIAGEERSFGIEARVRF